MWTPLRQEISQGDIFLSIPFPIIRFQEGDITITHQACPGMLVTYDCEYDKKNVPVALLAQVRLLDPMPDSVKGNIRADRIIRNFPLVLCAELEESFVEFGNVASVPKVLLQHLSENGKRIASLDDQSRLRLQDRVAAFIGLGRNEPQQPG